MSDFKAECTSIIERYVSIITQEAGWQDIIKIEPTEGDETNDIHLIWMLTELLCNEEQSYSKKHRWLGYIQGVMTAKGYINVLEERELTRSFLNGS